MYSLKEFLTTVCGMKEEDVRSHDLFCSEVNGRQALLVNFMTEPFGGYSFTIVGQGEVSMEYNGQHLTLRHGDMFIYSLGSRNVILKLSDDYLGISLMCDKRMLYTSTIRYFGNAYYLALAKNRGPVIHLSEAQFDHFWDFTHVIMRYLNNEHRYLNECLHTLFSLFILDLLNLLEHSSGPSPGEHSNEMLIKLMRLLNQNFKEQHSIGFYASELCITTTHLSRIVREYTGNTMKEIINSLLIKEAMWLLRSTDLTIAAISEKLHFANPASFTRFFTRMKGVSPITFRTHSG